MSSHEYPHARPSYGDDDYGDNEPPRTIEGLIVPYLDGELEPNDVVRVERAVEESAEFAVLVEEHRDVGGLVDRWISSTGVPVSTGSTITASLARARIRSERLRTWLPLAAAALIAIGLFTLWIAFSGDSRSPEIVVKADGGADGISGSPEDGVFSVFSDDEALVADLDLLEIIDEAAGELDEDFLDVLIALDEELLDDVLEEEYDVLEGEYEDEEASL